MNQIYILRDSFLEEAKKMKTHLESDEIISENIRGRFQKFFIEVSREEFTQKAHADQAGYLDKFNVYMLKSEHYDGLIYTKNES